MWKYLGIPSLATVLTVGACVAGYAAPAVPLTADAINNAQFTGRPAPANQRDPVMVRLQVLLDRAHLSPGIIDGLPGGNTQKALAMFQATRNLQPTGKLDAATWSALLAQDGEPVLTTYTLAKEDLAGPFVRRIPAKIKAMGRLKSLSYTSPVEMLSERFHVHPTLLKALNPGVSFRTAGASLVVPHVRRQKPSAEVKVKTVVIDKKSRAVKAYDANGRMVAFYPASIGSKKNPAPTGKFTIKAVVKRPTYYYTADLDFAKDLKKGESVKVAPGPNNPVGLVWMDLSKEGYGIHGTPEPAKIGKTQSHGCVRLTNWDVQELSQMVERGATAIFQNK